MPASVLGKLGEGSATSAGTTLAVVNTTGAVIPAGTLMVLAYTCDNIASVTAPTLTASASGGGTWNGGLIPPSQTGVTTTAGSGIWHGNWDCLTTASIASGATITTITSNQSAVKRVAAIIGVANGTATRRGGVGYGAGLSAAGTPSVTSQSPLVAGDIVVGTIGGENNAIPTGDSDTLNGSWSTIVGIATSGGQAATNVCVGLQAKLVTGTAAQVYNGVTANDSVNSIVVFVPVPDPSLTQAAYRFYDENGEESGKLADSLQTGDTSADVMTKTGPQEAQSFLGNGQRLTRVGWYMNKTGAPPGNVTCALYSHSGTFGTSSIPGSLIQSASNTVVANSLALSSGWIYFDFDGSVTLANGTPYVVTLGIDTATASGNTANLRQNTTTGTAAGNKSVYLTSSFVAQATYDCLFKVYTDNALAAQDTGVIGNLANGDGYGLVRIRLQSTTAVDIPATDDFTLQWEKNASGSWTNVGTGSVLGYNAPNLTEAEVTGNRLTGGTGTFTAGKVSEDGVADNVGWTGNNFTELVYSVGILASGFANNDVLRFRVVRNGSTAGMTYSVTPTITMTKPNAGSAVEDATYTQSAVGKRAPKGTANTGNWNAAVAAVGTRPVTAPNQGSATTSWKMATLAVPGGPAWSYDFTTMPDGPQPATLTTWGGSLPGKTVSGHFMCEQDWFFTKDYDTAIPDQNATTHLTAAEVVFPTASGNVWLIFAANADMTSYDAVEIHADGTWLLLYDGGGVGGSPNLPAFTTGVPYKLVVTYNETTGAVEVFINDVSTATGDLSMWMKIGNRSGFFIGGNLDTWLNKFYYGPQSAGVPGVGAASGGAVGSRMPKGGATTTWGNSCTAVGSKYRTLAIRRYLYSGSTYYYYLDWNPADFAAGGDRNFQAYLTIEPGTVAEDNVYLNITEWYYLYGPLPPFVTDGTLAKYEYPPNILGSVIAAQPGGTVYNLRFDHTGQVEGWGPATGRISLISPTNAFVPGTKWTYLILGNGVPNWIDGAVHNTGPLTYASDMTAAIWTNLVPTSWLYFDAPAPAYDVTGKGPTPPGLAMRAGAAAALQSAGLTLNISGNGFDPYLIQPIEKFTAYARSGFIHVDGGLMAWDPTTAKTAQLLISSHFTAADFPGLARAVDASNTFLPLYKTGGTVQWTGAEVFALKDQNITVQKVSGNYILEPVLVKQGTATGSHSWVSGAAGSNAAWSPASLTGLGIWLDAADLSGTVSAWPDKSGNNVVGVLKGSPAPAVRANALNGKSVVRFNANEGRFRYNGTTGIHTSWTVAVIAHMWQLGNPGRIFNAQYPPSNLLVGWWNGFQDVCYHEGFTSPDTKVAYTTDWLLYAADETSAPLTRFFRNDGIGVETLLGTTGTGGGWQGTLALSGYDPELPAETCDCEIAEIVMYNRLLTDPERLQVENYLRTKWLSGPSGPNLGSATTTHTWAPTTTGKRAPKATVATTWVVTTLGVATTLVNETFDGVAGTPLSAAGNYSVWNWSGSEDYPELGLNGAGAALAGYFPTVNFPDYAANTHKTALPDDQWAEFDFQYVTYPNRFAFIRLSGTYVVDTWGYNLWIRGINTAPRIMLYKDGATVGDAPNLTAMTANVPHTIRMEAQGAVVRVLLDGVQVITYTDPSPMHGAYTGLATDFGGDGVSANYPWFAHRAGSLGGGTSAIGKETPKGSATTSWNARVSSVQTFVDSFTGAAAPLDTANWATNDYSAGTLSTDGAGGIAQYTYGANTYKTPMPGAHWCEVDFLAGAGPNLGVFVRLPNTTLTNTGYDVDIYSLSGVNTYLYRNNSSVLQNARLAYPLVQGNAYTLRLEANGPSIRVLINGVAVMERADLAPVAGSYVGIWKEAGDGNIVTEFRAGHVAGAVGTRMPKASPTTTTYTEALTVAGKRSPVSTLTTQHTWAPAAIGAKPVVGAKQGAGTMQWAEAPVSVGKRAPKATANTGNYVEAVTAVGAKPQKGVASTGNYAEAVTSAGKRTPKGTGATGNYLQSVAATGKRTPKGAAATGFFIYNLTAQGVKPVPGVKQGSGIGYWRVSTIGGAPGGLLDPDTLAYIAATSLDSSFHPALDGLVIGLKAKGLWSKMAAIYPFVGGTEALHRWNLKDPRDLDAAYRLTFNLGTHTTALGYRPNPIGQTLNAAGRADTHFIPAGALGNVDSTHLAFYSLADQAPGDRCDMGCYNWDGAGSRFHIIAYYTAGEYYYGMSEDGISSCPGIGYSSGLFVSTRTASNFQAGYRNGVLNGSNTVPPSKGLPPVSVHIGGINYYQQGPSDLPCGFASIGTGLTAQDNADLYTVVQGYQTALSRQMGAPVTAPSGGGDPTLGWAVGKRFPKGGNAITWTNTCAAVGKKTQKSTAVTTTYLDTVTAAGKRTPKAAAAPVAYTEVLAAAGKKTPKGTSNVGNHSWTLIAQGIRPALLLKQGTGLVYHAWAPAAVGKRVAKGAASITNNTFVVAAAGKKLQKTTITTTYRYDPAAVGKKLQKGTGVVTYTWVLVVNGKKVQKARGDTDYWFSQVAVGSKGMTAWWNGQEVVALQYGDTPVLDFILIPS